MGNGYECKIMLRIKFSGHITRLSSAIYFQIFIQIIHFGTLYYSSIKALSNDAHMKLMRFREVNFTNCLKLNKSLKVIYLKKLYYVKDKMHSYYTGISKK